MPLTIACSGCGQRFSVADKLRGKRAKCKCGTILSIPAPEPEVTELELAPLSDDPLGLGSLSSNPLGIGSTPSRPIGAKSPLGAPAATGADYTRLIVGGGIAGGAVVLLLVMAIVISQFYKASDVAVAPTGNTIAGVPTGQQLPTPPVGSAATVAAAVSLGPLDPAGMPIPTFPELGTARVLPDGVQVFTVDTRSISTNGNGPGMAMRFRVYLPSGTHNARSLPCVLVAPAGTNMLTGIDLDPEDQHAEMLPYAQNGMAVIHYSIDGPAPMGEAVEPMLAAYKRFYAAKGGVLNGRNALEFALQRVPQADPNRLFSAGHSSAANISVLFGLHEPRLRGSIAYAPIEGTQERLAPVILNPQFRRLFTDSGNFCRDCSLNTYNPTKFQRPLFIFHAEDDENEPFFQCKHFADRLIEAGRPVTFSSCKTGGHYQSMIDSGIPNAIRWLKHQSNGSNTP